MESSERRMLGIIRACRLARILFLDENHRRRSSISRDSSIISSGDSKNLLVGEDLICEVLC